MALGMAGLTWRFDVQLGGVQVALFTGCTGLDAEYECFEWKEGGDNGTVLRLPGRLSYSNVKLTRPVDQDSPKLLAWFTRQAREPRREDATVRLYDGNGAVVATWVLSGAWPVKYSGPTLAAAGPESEAIAVETLEISHLGFAP